MSSPVTPCDPDAVSTDDAADVAAVVVVVTGLVATVDRNAELGVVVFASIAAVNAEAKTVLDAGLANEGDVVDESALPVVIAVLFVETFDDNELMRD